MVEIIPAIMPKNYDDLSEKMGLFAGVVSLVQLDIMDGKFVPSRTWPYDPKNAHFANIVSQEEGMPEWEAFDERVLEHIRALRALRPEMPIQCGRRFGKSPFLV